MSSDIPCPNCECQTTEFTSIVEEFQYRPDDDPNKAMLKARVTQGYCPKCQFQWTDHHAEAARNEAVIKFLQNETKELREENEELRKWIQELRSRIDSYKEASKA